jgi:hypothetical protein
VTTNAEEGIKVSGPDEGEPHPQVESRKTSIKEKSEKDVAAGESLPTTGQRADIQRMAIPQLLRSQHRSTVMI